jgi:hypothetical protein
MTPAGPLKSGIGTNVSGSVHPISEEAPAKMKSALEWRQVARALAGAFMMCLSKRNDCKLAVRERTVIIGHQRRSAVKQSRGLSGGKWWETKRFVSG